jgi:hypothetical protein
MPRRLLAALAFLFGVAAFMVGCGTTPEGRRETTKTSATSTATAPAAPSAPAAPAPRVLVDLLAALPQCDLEHRGQLLDAGTDAMLGRYGWGRGIPAGVTAVEHDGSTWARMLERRVQVSFSLLAPTSIFVAARVVGYGARSASVLLDDQPLGTLTLHREQIKIAQTPTTTLPVDPGLHMLTVRFAGRVRDGDAFADVDWLRIGIPDESTAAYAPPTLRDAIAPAAALGGVPHRALALHAPGSIRCGMRFARGATLRTSGAADAEVRLLRDGKKPTILRTVHLGGPDQHGWVDLDVSLDGFAPDVGALELAATQAPPGARVLFGDPAVVLPPRPGPTPTPARLVVVVALDGVERSELPPWSAAAAETLPALADLAASGAVFERHRAPSTVVAASIASLLTGLSPPAHGLVDAAARLPGDIASVPAIARDANVRTGMFTGVPYTFRAFGFAAGWERFVERPPSSGAPATAPIDDAAAWITELAKASSDARILAVVHARGGHPPWDVTPKELAAAPPREYGGLIEPRRASQTLARMRRARRAKIVTDADRQRVRALESLALAGQDRAIAALVAAIKAAGLWETTLFIVTSDVGSGATDLFADHLELKEPALDLPLYAHFPGGAASGRRVREPTEVRDLATTMLVALGLPVPKEVVGRDLAKLALGLDVAADTPQVATLDDRYSARWGDLVLSGRYPQPPSLCDLDLDPTCAFNRRDVMPLATTAIFRRVVALDVAMAARGAKREPASIDDDTAASLRVWGAD